MSVIRQTPRTIINSIGICCITFTLYLLSFNGIPIGSDEELYASVARNLVFNGGLNAGQLYGNLRLEGNYHGVEPAYPVLASFWYRFISQFQVGRLQGFYLLPILYVSVTAGIIVILAREMGFSHTAGAVAGILFGLGTIAWPYTKYLYRETLLVLLFVLCWLCFEMMFRKDLSWWKVLLWPGLFVGLLVLSILTKIMAVIIIPAFFIMFLLRKISRGEWNLKFWLFFLAGFFTFLALGIFLLTRKVTDANLFYRYTGTFLADAIDRYRDIPHDHFLEAIFAPLISPWKGVFIYSPPCLFAFFSVFQENKRKALYLFVLPFVTVCGFLIIQALAYDQEWWTATWSSRFLLPIIPLFIVAALPWLETIIQAKKLSGNIALLMGFALCILIQVGPVVFHAFSYDRVLLDELQQGFPDKAIWSISKMPLWGQWKLAFIGSEPALLLWRVFAVKPVLVVLAVFVGFVLVCGSVCFLRRNLDDELDTHKNYLFLITSLGIEFCLIILVLNLSKHDPFYFSPRLGDLKTICSQLSLDVKPFDTVVVKPYDGDAWYYFMNNDCVRAEWFSLPFDYQIISSPEMKDLTYRLFTKKFRNSERVWLVNQTWSSEDVTGVIFSDNGFYLVSQYQHFLPNSKLIVSLYSRKLKQ